MDEKYVKIGFTLGSTIEQVVNELLSYKQQGKLAYGKFNGVTLHSDTVTMDSAYKEIVGKTKAEFDTQYGLLGECSTKKQRNKMNTEGHRKG